MESDKSQAQRLNKHYQGLLRQFAIEREVRERAAFLRASQAAFVVSAANDDENTHKAFTRANTVNPNQFYLSAGYWYCCICRANNRGIPWILNSTYSTACEDSNCSHERCESCQTAT